MDKVHGYVDHIIYQNRENGYGVLSVIEEEEEVICVGFFRNVEAGETLDIQGNYVEHPMYGMQMMRLVWNAIWVLEPSRE